MANRNWYLEIDLGNSYNPVSSSKPLTLRRLVNMLLSFLAGATKSAMAIRAFDAAVAAVGTYTLANCSGNIAAVINGITTTVAADDTDDAANAATLAGLITANVTLGPSWTAAVGGSGNKVVTITYKTVGTVGNGKTLAVTGTGVTRSASTFSGGVNGVSAASATVTFAASDGAITVTVDGTAVAFTGSTSDDTTSAAKLATAINDSGNNPLVLKHVTATSALGVVTLTAKTPGPAGNAIQTSATGTGNTCNQTRLAGGSASGGHSSSVTIPSSDPSGNIVLTLNSTVYTQLWATSATATAALLAQQINADTVVNTAYEATCAAGVLTVKNKRGYGGTLKATSAGSALATTSATFGDTLGTNTKWNF